MNISLILLFIMSFIIPFICTDFDDGNNQKPDLNLSKFLYEFIFHYKFMKIATIFMCPKSSKILQFTTKYLMTGSISINVLNIDDVDIINNKFDVNKILSEFMIYRKLVVLDLQCTNSTHIINQVSIITQHRKKCIVGKVEI